MIEPGPGAWDALRALLAAPRDAPSDLADAELATVAEAARQGGVVRLALDAEPRLGPHLRADLAARVAAELALSIVERRAAAGLDAAGIERAVLLKGGATSRTIYASPGFRERSDLDLLVAEADFERASRALEVAGFVDRTPPSLVPLADGRPYERGFTLALGRGSAGCDLHRRLGRWREFSIDHPGILARATPLEERPLALPDPVDLAAHTCLHAAWEAFRVPLRSWVDMARLLVAEDIDHDALARRARAWHAGTAVWACYHVTRRGFGGPRSAALASLAPPPMIRALLERLLAGRGRFPLTPALPRIIATKLVGTAARDTWTRRALYLAEAAAVSAASRLG